jgi:hypothetical protein
MATPNGSAFGNPPPQIGQKIESIYSNTPQKTHVGLVVVKKIIDT